MTSTATLVWLGVGATLCFALPVALLVWWRRTRRAKLTPFFVGAAVFFVFARVLEALLHSAVLLSDNGVARALNANPYLFALYAGLAAGVFEETGRYIAFRVLLSKRRFPERDTAVTYGIGHGGCEAVVIVGAAYVAYIILALYLRRGNEPAAIALAGGNAAAFKAMRGALMAFTPLSLVPALLERAAAILLHIALSCFVFLAARDKTQWSWFPFAIMLHAIVDMPAALCQKGLLPAAAVELWLWVAALGALFAARKCYLEAADP